MHNDREHFYACRDRFNDLLKVRQGNTAEAAALFYYLNRTGYNGLCRFNSKGFFNVPFGRYAKIDYRKDFQIYKHVFRDWKFTNAYFDKVQILAEDFIYADPPYDVEFRQYSRGGFEWDEQKRLAEWLSCHPGPVVLVNQATPRIVDLYTQLGYELVYLNGPRRISCNGDRSPAREVLAIRNL
jgi:DNA adenine methylase